MDRFTCGINLVGDVPGDSLPLAVGVCGYENIVCFSSQLFQLPDNFFLAGYNFIAGFVMVVEIQADLLFRKILDMADRSEHHVIFSKIFVDGFRF